MSTRFRILAWCTLLVARAIVASVLTTRAVLYRRLADEVDVELHHEVDEVKALQRSHVDPVTKRPIADNDQLLQAALTQAASSQSQEAIARSDGKVIGRRPNFPSSRSSPTRASYGNGSP